MYHTLREENNSEGSQYNKDNQTIPYCLNVAEPGHILP